MGTLFAEQNDPRQNWGLTPLGPDVPKPQWKPAPIKQPLKTRLKSLSASGESLLLVKDQKPCAIVALPQNANSSSRAAAEVLQHAFAKMSGVTLPIVAEDKVQVQKSTFVADGQSYEYLLSIGNTQLAKAAGVSADDLIMDGYRLQTKGKVLFLVGQDKEPFSDAAGRPLPESGSTITRFLQANGTRNGAYALLERRFGCRWLWPEEAGGTVFPKTATLMLKPIHESDEPAMAQRFLRNYYPEKGINAYGRRQQQTVLPMLHRSYSSLLQKAKNSGAWFEAMKLGTSVEYNVGHSYSGYWKQYGETHPEYFALQADGTRNQTAHGGSADRVHLDVTNPDLIAHVAAEAIAKFDADPTLTSFSIAPNDGSYPSFCLCEVCRRLDPPNGDPVSFSIVGKDGKAKRIDYVSLTDRYVTFYDKIADIVVKKHPDKLLGAYAYSTYSSPPLYAKLAPNVFISYVGLSYFNDEQRQHDLESWDAWSQMADKLQLRPNALLGAYGIPAVFAHKLGDDIKHAYQTGMIGSDFDSLTHDWASRGLNYYVLAKLLWDPSQDVDALIADYCNTGFGPASPSIQKYFSLLETLTDEVAKSAGENARDEDAINPNSVRGVLSLIAKTYTPEKLTQLQTLLDDAKKQAADNPAALRRVQFLEQGIRYANAETAWARAYFAPSSPEKKQRVLDALDARLAVLTDLYDNHFYAQSIFMPLYREASMFKEYGWDPNKRNEQRRVAAGL